MRLSHPMALPCLAASIALLTSCGGGIPALVRGPAGMSSTAGGATSSSAQTLDLSTTPQYAMPSTTARTTTASSAQSVTASCLSVTNFVLTQNTAWWIAGTFSITNSCATAQSASGLSLMLGASGPLTATSFALNSLSFPVWQPTTVSTVGVSGNADELLLTLNTTGIVPSGGSVPGSFGYNPAGTALGGVTLTAAGSTPVLNATLAVTIDSSALSTTCTLSAPCTIPIVLSGQGGQFSKTIATVTNASLGKTTLTITGLDPGTYTLAPSSLPANVGVTIAPAATFTAAAGTTTAVSLVFAPKPTGGLSFTLVNPDAATFKAAAAPVTIAAPAGGGSIVDQAPYGTATTVTGLAAGAYTLTTAGLASASAGEYYAYPAHNATVTANTTTALGALRASASTGTVADTFAVNGLAAGDSLTLVFTDSVNGTSYTFNSETMSANETFRFLPGDTITVNVSAGAKYQPVAPFTFVQGSTAQTYTIALTAPVVTSSGTIYYHFYPPVTSTSGLLESLSLAGDNYTDLIMSNYVAGVMLGHTLGEVYPGLQFNKDYLYGTMLGQLLQENIETSLYSDATNLIDPSSQQSAVMSAGQGGPYQINNYDADLVNGGYSPQGYALLDYVAIQKNIGFTIAGATAQWSLPTPLSFNNKYYGPMLTTYFHLNDMRALTALGQTAWGPAPSFNACLTNLTKVPNAPLDVIVNYAYNQGYYGGLVGQSTAACASNVGAFFATENSYTNASGNSYTEYPYQVRFYLDELYNTSTVQPATSNHVAFNMTTLGGVFANAFQTLASVNGSGQYGFISGTQAMSAYTQALQRAGVPAGATLDLSSAASRASIYAVLENAIANLETALGTNFSATTTTQL